MKSKWGFTLLVFTAVILLAACKPAGPEANMANPASVYCEEHGGSLAIVQSPEGERGVCTFPDGSSCDEWAYFRGECQPGDSLTPSAPTSIATLEPQSADISSEEIAADGWRVYHSPDGAYVLHYPYEAQVSQADDPLQTITFSGPTVNGDAWPMIYISHPVDRPEYAPPEDVDLQQWLADNHLAGADLKEQQELTQVAGTQAVHLRRDRSPQSYAADIYYFAHNGQLYAITFLHTGDKEDWNLYDHFLQNFQFER